MEFSIDVHHFSVEKKRDIKIFHYTHICSCVILFFQVSKLPRLPDIHSNGRQEKGEIVLNPATLEGGVD